MTHSTASYRLQFNAGFGFARAAAVVPYLAELGISHLYASPVFCARRGSLHGYDGVDPNRLNPELGTPEEWEALAERRRAAGMGWIQDIVPNHMAFDAANGMLADVFESGPHSRFYGAFDIDWHYPDADLEGRVMAPFLGDRYDACLRNGDIRIAFDAAGFAAVVYDALRFPLDIGTYLEILDHPAEPSPASPAEEDPDALRWTDALDALESLTLATDPDQRRRQGQSVKQTLWELYGRNAGVRRHIDTRLEDLNGRPGDRDSWHALDHLLTRQRFRLCWWKNANEEINYRRFFDINELIALRQEDPAVFTRTHDLLFQLTAAGRVDGVRIDHVDGLADPAGYLHRLRGRLGAKPTILVEKILAPEEPLPRDWPIQGTTGYDATHWLNAVFVEWENETRFNAVYEGFTGRTQAFPEVVRRAKEEILAARLAGDLANLARRVQAIAAGTCFADHLTLNRIEAALTAILVRFPIYRTYLGGGRPRPADEEAVSEAVSRASEAAPHLNSEIGLVRQLLLEPDACRRPEAAESPEDERLRAVWAFQQLSSALMAKGCEDTAFYRYHRLLSLNEVGSEPERFGCRLERFHDIFSRRAADWPRAMNSTATHDSKRGEDLRARLNVLSEIPNAWELRLNRWHGLTREDRIRTDTGMVPDRNTAYLLFQTLLGAWPAAEDRPPRSFVERIQAYMIKAVREAGEDTSWIDPREDYENALTTFIATILEASPDNGFLADFGPFCREIAFYGRFNGLSQCLLKMGLPGVPDFYQGTELPQFVLVDPDNRQPVDYEERARLLQTLRGRDDPLARAAELVKTAADGRIKLFLIARTLEARRRHAALFTEGRYLALPAEGAFRRHVVAFAREAEGRWALVVVPRFPAGLVPYPQAPLGRDVWQDTAVRLPSGAPRTWRHCFTEEVLENPAQVPVGEALAHFPVALLTGEAPS